MGRLANEQTRELYRNDLSLGANVLIEIDDMPDADPKLSPNHKDSGSLWDKVHKPLTQVARTSIPAQREPLTQRRATARSEYMNERTHLNKDPSNTLYIN